MDLLVEHGENMSRLKEHKQSLYELRFSPMCKPAAEVANLTQMESHSVRARVMMMWRVCEGHLEWGQREAELLYETTLDSISEAFDVFHYPISRYMLDARADVWDLGMAPQNVNKVVENAAGAENGTLPKVKESALLLAGEISQLEGSTYLDVLADKFKDLPIWVAQTGVLPYVLGAHTAARKQAEAIVNGILESGVNTVIVDGPETAWGLLKVYPDLGIQVPVGVEVQLLSDYILRNATVGKKKLGKTLVHDSRPSCLLADNMPNHLAVMPGYVADETAFGEGDVFDLPRKLVDSTGAERVFSNWTRCLAKSCGADDGLWLTYPKLAKGLLQQRLGYAKDLGAETIVTTSPLCAAYLSKNVKKDDLRVYWMPELIEI